MIKHVVRDGPVPMAVGRRVAILRPQTSGALYIEGFAVVRVACGRNRYRVQFDADPLIRQRVVHAQYQTDPKDFIRVVEELRHAPDDLAIDDFFPRRHSV